VLFYAMNVVQIIFAKISGLAFVFIFIFHFIFEVYLL